MAYNFKKMVYGTEVVDYGVPYDYVSIMHYPWTAFSKNGKKTLEPIRLLNGKTPYVKLSDDDALQARRMYKCSGTNPSTTCTLLLDNLRQINNRTITDKALHEKHAYVLRTYS